MNREASSIFVDLISRAKTDKRPIILDGAVGTELDNRGADTRSPLWSGLAPLDNPDMLRQIHEEYVRSGSEIVATCTFRTSERAFKKANQKEGRFKDAIAAAVALARRASKGRCLVAGSIGPLEDCFSPKLAPSGRQAEKEHQAICEELIQSGVDLLWLETIGTLGELKAAVSAANKAASRKGVPFASSVVTRKDGNLISGEPIEDAFGIAALGGASVFGINCVPPSHVDAALGRVLGACGLPVAVYANLGRSDQNQDWRGSAYLEPEAYADLAQGWVKAGVSLVGGCCGSSPAHIRALAKRFSPAKPPLDQ